MLKRYSRVAAVGCLIALFALLSFLLFQNATVAQVASLNDAKTVADVKAYLQQQGDKEVEKFNAAGVGGDKKALHIALGKLLLEAGDKILSLAKDLDDKKDAYSMKAQGLSHQEAAKVDGVKEKFAALLKELDANPDFKEIASSLRFDEFIKNSLEDPMSAEEYTKFKADIKAWMNRKEVPIEHLARAGVYITEYKGQDRIVYAEEMLEFLKSADCTVTEEEKKAVTARLEEMLRRWQAMKGLNFGQIPELYGKTLDDKDFDWKSLRGKYVLVKFTATWCAPCKMEIPGMIEAYAKYKDKGLEIVSIYVMERSADPVDNVKKFIEAEKINWIVLSEALTTKGEMPAQGKKFSISSVPTMVLVDKEGKVILTNARGESLQDKLEEIFKK